MVWGFDPDQLAEQMGVKESILSIAVSLDSIAKSLAEMNAREKKKGRNQL